MGRAITAVRRWYLFQEAAQASNSPTMKPVWVSASWAPGQKEAGFEALTLRQRAPAGAGRRAAGAGPSEAQRGPPGSRDHGGCRQTGTRNVWRNLLGVSKLAAGTARRCTGSLRVIQASPACIPPHLNLGRLDGADGQIEKARQRYHRDSQRSLPSHWTRCSNWPGWKKAPASRRGNHSLAGQVREPRQGSWPETDPERPLSAARAANGARRRQRYTGHIRLRARRVRCWRWPRPKRPWAAAGWRRPRCAASARSPRSASAG